MDGTLEYAEHKLDEAIRQGETDIDIAYWRGYRDCAKAMTRDVNAFLARAEAEESAHNSLQRTVAEYKARAEKAERERDDYKADLEFYKEGCHRLSLELDEYEKGE